MYRWFLATFLLLQLGFLGFTPSMGWANSNVEARKIDIAGRQRMLSQRLAKAACFVASFSEVERHKKMLLDSNTLFSESLSALKDGHSAWDFPAEQNTAIRQELETLARQWTMIDFGANLLGESSTLPGLGVDLIAQFNLAALKQADRVVKTMEHEYSAAQNMDSHAARALNLAGRQRMLTQKAAKEFCLITYGINVNANSNDLLKTVESFDNALDSLRYGNPQQGITPVSTPEIIDALDQISSSWQATRTILIATANGKQAHTADFKKIAQSNEALLQASDNVVRQLLSHYKVQNAQ